MYDHDGQTQHQQKGKEHAVRYGHDNAMLGYLNNINCFWQHFVWSILKNSGIPGGLTTKLPRHFIRDPGA